MTIKVALEHRTSYSFDRTVRIHPHVVRLRPAPHSRTPIESYSLTVEPGEHFLNWQQDAFANYLGRLVFPEPARSLSLTVGLVADLTAINPFDFFIEEAAETIGFSYDDTTRRDLEQYLLPVDDGGAGSGPDPQVQAWVRQHRPAGTERTIDFLVSLNQALCSAVGYTVRLEAGVQTPAYTLASGIGSCRDSAWLLVSVLRQLGLAARFVSGYLIQLTSDIKAIDGPSGPDADFTDLHAWCEVYLPGAGWVGMDPTSGLFAGEGHIPLAATPYPGAAAPITGATDVCHATLDFSNTVTRFHEDPRVTKPYTPAQWEQITVLGATVDASMQRQGVDLTMGGEPTFVSLTDQNAAEWTTDADGPDKRHRASALTAKLRAAQGAGTVVQRRQGKWYPGEPLPRWDIGLIWRVDGVPLWREADLLADPWATPEAAAATIDNLSDTDTDTAPGGTATAATAADFMRAFTRRIGLPEDFVQPVYEDPLTRLADLQRLPAGTPSPARDALAADDDLAPAADTAPRRQALLARLDAAVTTPTALLLSLFRTADDTAWESTVWQLRRGRIVLAPGDSPAGLRLPLSSVSWDDTPEAREADPIAPAPPLPHPDAEQEAAAAEREPRTNLPRTAVVAEVRGGELYIFLPPTDTAEAFVELVAITEDAAAEIHHPVVLEGYGPPHDPRLQSLSVTPDPGVIEVNVNPTNSFAEQSQQLQSLYHAAREVGLGTESFDLDGTHGGTGGGNHITLGGVTPARSPLLRRPDLLVSMLTYWQRHPALSYLFSGRFIGTTSQAPRFDEGREQALYEMEIAFAEIDRLAAASASEVAAALPDTVADTEPFALPWITDRALRHLLTDITGNTHRAEFCIDKLYSPDSARGRLGILELRGFEMPPHHQMAMVQSLLVRSLVEWFWRTPYRAPLQRHGDDLHGRWLLPHHLIADIGAVTADLRAAGLDFQASWLDPFTEFRFPRLGTVGIGEYELELRGAIEPWTVLGEEATAGGTARYVDSSIERVQVRLLGPASERFLLTCNGFPVPLTATGDDRVAGVRLRAWQPPSALHPTITIDTPLQFDLVDLHNGYSVGGATYHVVHPGGRNYERPPVNAVEAESRRNGRVVAGGHRTAGWDLGLLAERRARAATDHSAPGILDLRRARTVLG